MGMVSYDTIVHGNGIIFLIQYVAGTESCTIVVFSNFFFVVVMY